jgi:hypothetical protein
MFGSSTPGSGAAIRIDGRFTGGSTTRPLTMGAAQTQ